MIAEEKLATNTITLTEAAAARVLRLLEERHLSGHALRLFVTGGGCSGLQYGMALEAEPRETDECFTFGGLDVVVDPVSIAYLTGAKIDYVDDPAGGAFRIENPNALAGCGCGQTAGAAAAGESSCSGGCCS